MHFIVNGWLNWASLKKHRSILWRGTVDLNSCCTCWLDCPLTFALNLCMFFSRADNNILKLATSLCYLFVRANAQFHVTSKRHWYSQRLVGIPASRWDPGITASLQNSELVLQARPGLIEQHTVLVIVSLGPVAQTCRGEFHAWNLIPRHKESQLRSGLQHTRTEGWRLLPTLDSQSEAVPRSCHLPFWENLCVCNPSENPDPQAAKHHCTKQSNIRKRSSQNRTTPVSMLQESCFCTHKRAARELLLHCILPFIQAFQNSIYRVFPI